MLQQGKRLEEKVNEIYIEATCGAANKHDERSLPARQERREIASRRNIRASPFISALHLLTDVFQVQVVVKELVLLKVGILR